jgi:hypothetical protein
VPQVRADGVRPPVDELGRQPEVVERLVPELPLGLRGEDPVPDPGQRRRDDQGTDQVGTVPRDGLGDPAADVVAGQDHLSEPKLADQPGDAPGLGRGVVLPGRFGRMLVGLAEPPQVGDDHVGGPRHERGDRAIIGPVSGPSVQQQHRRTRSGPFVGQPELVDRCFGAHTGHYLQRAGVDDRLPAAVY